MKNRSSFNASQRIRFMYKQLVRGKVTSQEWWALIARYDKVLVTEEINKIEKAETRLRAYAQSAHFLHKIRKYCNFHGRDVEPYEVIKTISFRCVMIRKMKAELIQTPVQHTGGFAAHTENNTQEWDITSDPDGATLKIFLSSHGWNKGKFRMNDKPIKFYDYNF